MTASRLSLIALAALLCPGCDEETDPPGHQETTSTLDSSLADGATQTPDQGTSDQAAADQVPADQGAPGDAPASGPKVLPKATQPCPTITEGEVTFLGVTVRVWVGANPKAAKGPLVFYWHGTGSTPMEAYWGLGPQTVGAIKAAGGMVVAPKGPTGLTGAQTGGTVWRAGDHDLADEILACAIQQVGIDTSHVHAMGMSAGGLHTAQMSYSRSGYLASVATYSGGLLQFGQPPPSQDPANKLAAMIFHGGDTDVLIVSFKDTSEKYLKDLQAKGHFAFICAHTQGHWLPPNGGPGAWRFFQDHPFGTSPSPYKAGLPASIPAYCAL